MKIPETLTVDVYSNAENKSSLQYMGRLSSKLDIITDVKKQKEYIKTQSKSVSSDKVILVSSSPDSAESSESTKTELSFTKKVYKKVLGNPFKSSLSDSPNIIIQKFIQLLALGPISEALIMEKLDLPNIKLKSLMSEFAQVYNPQDSFTQHDKYPKIERLNNKLRHLKGNDESDDQDDTDNLSETSETSNDVKYILKDKSYKEVQPWNWSFYSDFECNLIKANIHRALTRLGYSESHPLRKKICDESSSSSEDEKKLSSLGGGFIVSKSKKKATPSIPSKEKKSNVSTPIPNGSNVTSPMDHPKSVKSSTPVSSLASNGKRKYLASSFSSSEDEGRTLKKTKPVHVETSISSEDDDIPLSKRDLRSESDSNPPEIKSAAKRLEYYTSLATKFKLKYSEYKELYLQLQNGKFNRNKGESKKQLIKLFGLHNALSQWKKTLWDFDDETKRKSKIMNLSKHKKSDSSNATTQSTFNRAQSASPAPSRTSLIASRIPSRPSGSASHSRSSLVAAETLKQKPKVHLNY